MKEDKGRLFIESLQEFLKASKGQRPVFMDEKAFRQIIETLTEQAEKTKDSVTRAALEKLIADLSAPVLEADQKEAEEAVGGVVELGEDLREQLLQAVAEKKGEDLEALRSIIPDTAIINNSKLAQEIIDNFAGEGNIPILVSKRKARKEFEIIASMAFEGPNMKITGRQPYTAFDRAVLNGICSLWQAGNTAFTPAMVYRAMNGLSGSGEGGVKVSPQAVGSVTRSIEKQRVTRLTIDCTEQMSHYKDLKSAKFDAMMLSVEGVEMTAQNGKKVKAYAFTNPKRPPVLYEYSRSIGQVLSVPPRLLNSTATINTTEEIIVLREYLIRRIEGMRNAKNALKSQRINYAGIYNELGIILSDMDGDAKKNTTRRIRKNTEALLDHLKGNGYIKGYVEYKDGRSVAGVEIIL